MLLAISSRLFLSPSLRRQPRPACARPAKLRCLHTAGWVLCTDLLCWLVKCMDTHVINFRRLQLPSRDEGATGRPNKHSSTSCPTRYLSHSPYSSAGLTQKPHRQEQAAHRYAVFKLRQAHSSCIVLPHPLVRAKPQGAAHLMAVGEAPSLSHAA